ncbi:MAG: SIMPL domain-containing protein [Oscillospiraceae bacterium]|nr:SIMPL domain-containing protein [Oscillospiraceae bacterium]
MERTISVRGVGSLRKKPDYVTISLELEAKDMDYEKAVAASSGQIEELTAASCAVGFRMEDLKTSSYQVRTEYRSEQDENRNYRQVFDGYVCRTGMRLAFDFSVLRLGEALSAVGACSVRPELNIAFTVKDPAAAHGELLRAAAANARERRRSCAKPPASGWGSCCGSNTTGPIPLCAPVPPSARKRPVFG